MPGGSPRSASSALDSVLNEYEQTNKGNFKEANSKLESVVINSKKPVKTGTRLPVIEVNGVKGYWINKDEVENWGGKVPVDQYQINYDRNPKIIKKKITEKINHSQLIGVNYLRPPTPPKPGDIIIREEPPRQAPPLSPIIKREVYYVYNETCKKQPKQAARRKSKEAAKPIRTTTKKASSYTNIATNYETIPLAASQSQTTYASYQTYQPVTYQQQPSTNYNFLPMVQQNYNIPNYQSFYY